MADGLPAPDDFRPVRCIDLACGRLTYFVHHAPDYLSVVIAVGQATNPIFLIAKVKRSRSAFLFDKPGYLVDCTFIKKLTGVYRWDEKTRQVEQLTT